jgi:hypothetical protein
MALNKNINDPEETIVFTEKCTLKLNKWEIKEEADVFDEVSFAVLHEWVLKTKLTWKAKRTIWVIN